MSTYFVGINISKYKHDGCIINAADQSIVVKFTFLNGRERFEQLLSPLQSISTPEHIRIGLNPPPTMPSTSNTFLRKPPTALWKLIQFSSKNTRNQHFSAGQIQIPLIANPLPAD